MQIRVFFFCEKSLVRVESFYKGALEVQGTELTESRQDKVTEEDAEEDAEEKEKEKRLT